MQSAAMSCSSIAALPVMTPLGSGKLGLYRCRVCGSSVQVLKRGGMSLHCCGRDMVPEMPKSQGEGTQAHQPTLLERDGQLMVVIGQPPHIMDEDHRIVWIEIVAEGRCWRQFLEPGQPPQAAFPACGGLITARAYCSVHGLWKSPLFHVKTPDGG